MPGKLLLLAIPLIVQDVPLQYIIIPSGGSISGTNINLNGGYIDEVYNQAFSSSATFSQVYEDSWLSPNWW